MGERIYYLDHAAATPCDPRVVSAMEPYLTNDFYNPSASYGGGRLARAALEGARDAIALTLGAKANDIIFTAGATESINLAILGAVPEGSHVVISGVEHAAVRGAAERRKYTVAAVDARGLVMPEAIKSALQDDTVLVSVALADNEFGTVQPIADIARMLEDVRSDRRSRNVMTPLYFHTDGSQAALSLDLKVSRLGVDMLTLNAAKCYGPKQVGLLWAKPHVHLIAQLYGGGQERSLRSGTENVAGAVGFAFALELAQKGRHDENSRLASMRERLVPLLEEGVQDPVIDGHSKRHLPGHIHLHVAGLDAERVVFHLDNENIYIATGAACAANKATRSPSLEAIGLNPEEADGSLRITLGHLNHEEDIPHIAERIINAIQTERML